jgi:hypothetical protein
MFATHVPYVIGCAASPRTNSPNLGWAATRKYQPFARPLNRDAQLMEQSGDMAIVVPRAKLPVDWTPVRGSSPDRARAARGLRFSVNQHAQLFGLTGMSLGAAPVPCAGAAAPCWRWIFEANLLSL